jgi:hypothetical protein
MKRKAISKSRRFEVFKRDGFTCQYCGDHPPKAVLHVDHITPVSLGGGNEIENLVTSCASCNLGKSATPLNQVPKSLTEKAKETQEREAQIAGYAAIMNAARQRLEDDIWRVAEAIHPGASDGYPRDRYEGIKIFVNRLGVHEVLEACDIAIARYGTGNTRSFKYFCGVCWNRINGAFE